MSPKTKQQNEEIRQEKRALILDTALEIFATYGFHGSSISTIAQRACISKGLLYNYFKSKEDLLRAIVNDGMQEVLGTFAPYFEKGILEGDMTPQLFREIFKQMFQVIKDKSNFWRLYFALAMQPGVLEIIAMDYESMMFTYLELLEKYYKKQGSKNPRADGLHAYILLDGIIINYIQPHKEFTVEELENLVIKGLENPIY
jgi:AcrR family transcriptional regulator